MNSLLYNINNESRSIRYKKSIKIVDTNDRKYVIKKNNKKRRDIYNYLLSKNFNNFPNVFSNMDDEYEITEYIDDVNVEQVEKLENMISLVSILHNRTMYYRELDLDEIKEIYEEKSYNFNYLFNYYQDLNNIIEEEIYMSPTNYYLILNISKIYNILVQGKNYLDEWYKIVSSKKTIRFCLNHNNLDIDHLISNNGGYLISWDRADKGFIIDDIYDLFIRNYEYINIETLLSIYENKCRLFDYEYLLLLSNLCTINKLSLDLNALDRIKEVSNLITYIERVEGYLLKNNSNKTNNNS